MAADGDLREGHWDWSAVGLVPQGNGLAAEYRLNLEDLERREANLRAQLAEYARLQVGDYEDLAFAYRQLYHAVETYLREGDAGFDTAAARVELRRCMWWDAEDMGHWAYGGRGWLRRAGFGDS